MARGVRRAFPRADIVECPVADGGEGTQDALLRALGGRIETVAVAGPLGEQVDARIAFLNGGRAVVESAQASGLALVASDRHDALRSSTFGTGMLLQVALERVPAAVLVCVGGTASTDGGVGAAAATGWTFTDRAGDPVGLGGHALSLVAAVRAPDERSSPVPVIGLCDVDVPLTGERGAARTFAPQKGASADEVEVLERGMRNLELRLREDLGVDVSELPHAGAGGGLGAGLAAFFGATLVPGFDVVAEAAGLPGAIEGADLVITGEGRVDRQTLYGKSVFGVTRLARSRRVPCAAVAGAVGLPEGTLRDIGIRSATDLVARYGERRALVDAPGCLADATYAMVTSMLA